MFSVNPALYLPYYRTPRLEASKPLYSPLRKIKIHTCAASFIFELSRKYFIPISSILYRITVFLTLVKSPGKQKGELRQIVKWKQNKVNEMSANSKVWQ
jgi:hypothetical protein